MLLLVPTVLDGNKDAMVVEANEVKGDAVDVIPLVGLLNADFIKERVEDEPLEEEDPSPEV